MKSEKVRRWFEKRSLYWAIRIPGIRRLFREVYGKGFYWPTGYDKVNRRLIMFWLYRYWQKKNRRRLSDIPKFFKHKKRLEHFLDYWYRRRCFIYWRQMIKRIIEDDKSMEFEETWVYEFKDSTVTFTFVDPDHAVYQVWWPLCTYHFEYSFRVTGKMLEFYRVQKGDYVAVTMPYEHLPDMFKFLKMAKVDFREHIICCMPQEIAREPLSASVIYNKLGSSDMFSILGSEAIIDI